MINQNCVCLLADSSVTQMHGCADAVTTNAHFFFISYDDMDDRLEVPHAREAPSGQQRVEDPVDSSDEDDGGPDWTNLP
jgi:hypothetical protein